MSMNHMNFGMADIKRKQTCLMSRRLVLILSLGVSLGVRNIGDGYRSLGATSISRLGVSRDVKGVWDRGATLCDRTHNCILRHTAVTTVHTLVLIYAKGLHVVRSFTLFALVRRTKLAYSHTIDSYTGFPCFRILARLQVGKPRNPCSFADREVQSGQAGSCSHQVCIGSKSAVSWSWPFNCMQYVG